jgi:Domain of unknown function (DUF4913)
VISTPDPTGGGDLSALWEIVGQHTEDIDALRDAVAHLSHDIAQLAPAETTRPSAYSWADLDAPAATNAWAELRSWVDTILVVRYPHTATGKNARLVCSCWYRHPYAVEEITALYVAWLHAYRDPTAPSTAPNDWQRRLSDACGRVSQHVQCAKEHADDKTTTESTDAAFTTFVKADVLARPEAQTEPE